MLLADKRISEAHYSGGSEKPIVMLLTHSDETINKRIMRQFFKKEWRTIVQKYKSDLSSAGSPIATDVLHEINTALAGTDKKHLKTLVIEANLGRSGGTPPILPLVKILMDHFPNIDIFLYSGTEEYEIAFSEAVIKLRAVGCSDTQLSLVNYSDKVGNWKKLSEIAGASASHFDASPAEGSSSASAGESSAERWALLVSASDKPKVVAKASTTAVSPKLD